MKKRILLIPILFIALMGFNKVNAQTFYDSIPNKCATADIINISTQKQTPTGAKGIPILRLHYTTIVHTNHFDVYSENHSLIKSNLGSRCSNGTITISLDPDSVNSWAADGQINF